MKKNHKKRIIGVIAVFMIIASVFSLYNIYAVDPVKNDNENTTETPQTTEPKECELKDNVDIGKLLGLTIKEVENLGGSLRKYELKSVINGSDSDYVKELKNVKLTIKRVNNDYSSAPVGQTLVAGSGDKGKITFTAELIDSMKVLNYDGKNIGERSNLPYVVYVEMESTDIGPIMKGNIFKNSKNCNGGLLRTSVFLLDGGWDKIFTGNEIATSPEMQDAINKLQASIADLNRTPASSSGTKPGVDNTTNIICDGVPLIENEKDLTAELVYSTGKKTDGFVKTNEVAKKVQFFCSIKKITEGKHIKFTLNKGELSSENKQRSLVCDPKVTDKGNENKPGSNDMYINGAYNISANKKAFFGYNVIEKIGRKYYNGVTPTCNATCEEAVLVEYGPPIAAIAGLCYEYQVRVTSVVDCKRTTEPPAPTKLGICYPKPTCVGSDGQVFDQGGPNEDFDKCINSCDGGKYTSKCSKKCYEKVYGKTSSSKKTSTTNEYTTSKMFRTVDYACSNSSEHEQYRGHYYRGDYDKYNNGDYQLGSEIKYCGRFADWYSDSMISDHWYENTRRWFTAGDGIPRATKEWNIYHRNCDDDCTFSSCSGYAISSSERDGWYIEDLKKYKEVKEVCEAAVTCANRSTTTEFTISISNDKTTINFPYTDKGSGSKETLKHDCNVGGYGALSNSILLHYGGCYGACDGSNWYHSHISFPGSWVNNKKDAITYKKPDSETVWTEKKGKICLPSNFKSENVNWYNHYLYVKEIKPYLGSGNNPYSIDKYCSDEYFKNAELPAIEKYNILATIENFGYYDWNFNIKCFYGLKNQNASGKDSCTSESCKDCSTGINNYRIRSVDNVNLFPSTNGDATTSRKPGFNWSKYSDLGIDASNRDQDNELSLLAQQIQKTGNAVYDGNPEYRIILDTATRQLIDSANKIEGTYINHNNMLSYESILLRNKMGLSSSGCANGGSNCIPSLNSLGLINYNPDQN